MRMAFQEWPELRQLKTHGWLEELQGAVLCEQRAEMGSRGRLQVLGFHAEDLRAWDRLLGGSVLLHWMQLDPWGVNGLEQEERGLSNVQG